MLPDTNRWSVHVGADPEGVMIMVRGGRCNHNYPADIVASLLTWTASRVAKRISFSDGLIYHVRASFQDAA
jgi:hypothetical protein